MLTLMNREKNASKDNGGNQNGAMNTTDWKISKATKVCRLCERPLTDHVFYSALMEEEEGLVRSDYCPECWEKTERGAVFSYWKARPVEENRKKRRLADNTVVLDLFWKFENADTAQKIRLRFAMALYLVRRKVFRLRNVKRNENGEILVISYPKGDLRNIEIVTPELSEETIAAANAELRGLLEIELS